ncbi:uncharacterized protein DFL_000476 [Arthrobotrys flagrans]|uniref:F-box domain-containing protein n=1 Tax=Arthrobotrys flagrans TaxID=97331 RepID=A0A437ADW3_ARTFL|nr:hypothetical protein DFL_000476 [Arthrobotrys flagrans]
MASRKWTQPVEVTIPDAASRASFIALPPETLTAVLSFLDFESLKAVALTCSGLRSVAARLLYRNLVIRWNRNAGFPLARLEAILSSSKSTLSHIKRIDVIQDDESGHANAARQLPPPGLKPTEDLLFRLLLKKLRPNQLRSISLSSVEGVGADTAALLLNTQRNLAQLDLSTMNEVVDIMPFAFSINRLESFGFHLGEKEVAVSRAFAFMYHVLKRNCDTIKSLYLSFNEKSELYKELEKDSSAAMNTRNQYDSATAQILRLFVGDPSSGGELIHFRALRQLRLQHLPSFGALFNMGGPTLTERLNLENMVFVRIDHCKGADRMIKDISGKVPHLRVLQLIHSCEWATIEAALTDLPPLEVLHVKFTDGKPLGSEINPRAFERHRDSIRSMWLECQSPDPDLRPHTISCILKLFKVGARYYMWPRLKELALQTDDYGFMGPYFSILRYIRILPTRTRQVRTVTSEKEAALRNCDMYLQLYYGIQRRLPTLEVIAVTASDALTFSNGKVYYFVVEFVRTKLGNYAPVVSKAKAHQIRSLFQGLNLMEFERGERVWSDVEGEMLA